MRGKKLYSYSLEDEINRRIPQSILDEMKRQGWNALGVYETVKEVLWNERKAKEAAAIKGEGNGR